MSFTYKGLKAQLSRHIVTDTELDRQIQRLQQQNPRIGDSALFFTPLRRSQIRPLRTFHRLPPQVQPDSPHRTT